MTRIAVPVVSPNNLLSELSDHFGMSEYFAIIDYESGAVGSLRIIHNDPYSPEHKSNAQFLADNGVKIVLAGSIGPHMLGILLGEGIRVFKGAAGTLEDVIEDYKAGYLTEVYSAGDMD